VKVICFIRFPIRLSVFEGGTIIIIIRFTIFLIKPFPEKKEFMSVNFYFFSKETTKKVLQFLLLIRQRQFVHGLKKKKEIAVDVHCGLRWKSEQCRCCEVKIPIQSEKLKRNPGKKIYIFLYFQFLYPNWQNVKMASLLPVLPWRPTQYFCPTFLFPTLNFKRGVIHCPFRSKCLYTKQRNILEYTKSWYKSFSLYRNTVMGQKESNFTKTKKLLVRNYKYIRFYQTVLRALETPYFLAQHGLRWRLSYQHQRENVHRWISQIYRLQLWYHPVKILYHPVLHI